MVNVRVRLGKNEHKVNLSTIEPSIFYTFNHHTAVLGRL